MLTFGCIEQSPDTDDCYKIESARCEFRYRCDEDFDVDGCKVYYEEQCRARHIPGSPSDKQLNNCVAAIDALGSPDQCTALDALEDNSELCAFVELDACQLFICDDDTETDNANEETMTDTESESEIPSGLNPEA